MDKKESLDNKAYALYCRPCDGENIKGLEVRVLTDEEQIQLDKVVAYIEEKRSKQ